MRRLNVVAVALLFVATTAAAEVRGAWTAEVNADGSMQMNLSHGHSRHGETMAVADFTGISPAAVRASAQTPVNFELHREAGTVAFEGTFKNGFGAGQFTFTPNPNYRPTLRSLGVTSENRDGDDEQELLTMALLDVSTDFIRSMQDVGYRVPAEKYVAMRIFRVTPQIVQELANLGYAHLDSDDLIAFRIHRVTPDFIRDLRNLGYTEIPAGQLVAMRIHRVTPEFIREMKDAGYEHVPVEKLIAMRIHGIDANFVKKMNGFK